VGTKVTRQTCKGCGDGVVLDFAFTMAFQPILDLGAGTVWRYEALVRGPEGQSAASILDRVTEATLYRFDQAARVKAIELAGRLFPAGGDAKLSISSKPNAVYEPAACIRASLEAARRFGFAHDRISFEFTENERFRDIAHVAGIVAEYRRQGFLTALDDFGAGYAGLGLLANFRPDLIKIDLELIRSVDADAARRTIVAGIVGMATALGVTVIADGVETRAEVDALRAMGIALFQGCHFAKPAFEALPVVAGFEDAPEVSLRVA